MNAEIDYEKELLRKCSQNDAESIEEFDDRSYLGAILIAVDERHRRLGSPLTDEEVDLLSKILIGEVYKQWKSLPRKRRDLKSQLEAYIPRAFEKLVRQKPHKE